MHAQPLSYGKKDEFSRYARSICARCSRLAGPVRDRETVIKRATSSSVIPTSSACRQVAMIPLLVQIFSNEESIPTQFQFHGCGFIEAGFHRRRVHGIGHLAGFAKPRVTGGKRGRPSNSEALPVGRCRQQPCRSDWSPSFGRCNPIPNASPTRPSGSSLSSSPRSNTAPMQARNQARSTTAQKQSLGAAAPRPGPRS